MSPRRRFLRTLRPEDYENPSPIYCVWEITLACDLGCKHCGSRAGKARPNELSTRECLDVVDQLASIGVRETTLIGGEAYLREDWTEIAAALVERGIACSVVTGARNLTQERIDAAARAGVSSISISIDGLRKTHDALRGPRGSWDAAVDAARRVAASPIRLAANTQINRLSMPELPALADLMVELGIAGWQVQLTVPMGRAADRPDLLLQPSDLLELFPLLLWIKRTKLAPRDIDLAPGNNIGYFSPFDRLLRWRSEEKGNHWNGCSAGKWTLGLEADGKIKGCPSLPSHLYTGGNIRDAQIADVIKNAPELIHIEERTRQDLWGYCKSCYYADVCKAGCTWTAHTLLGKAGNNPYCIYRALDFESRGLQERIRPREKAPGEPFDFGRYDLVVEPISTAKETPKILDLAMDRVTSASFTDPSLWEEEEINARLVRWTQK